MPSLHAALKGCCDFSPCVEKTARRQTGNTSSYKMPNTVGQNIVNQFMGQIQQSDNYQVPVSNSAVTNNEPSFRSQNTETQFYTSSRSPAEISTDQNFELTERQTNRNMQQGPQAKFEPFQIQLKSAAGGSQSKWQNWGDWSICSKSCGSGVQTRHRECNDGNFCPGRNYEEKVCETPCSQSSYWPSY